MTSLIILILVVGVICYLLPIPEKFQKLLYIILVVLVILALLNLLGYGNLTFHDKL